MIDLPLVYSNPHHRFQCSAESGFLLAQSNVPKLHTPLFLRPMEEMILHKVDCKSETYFGI